MASVLELSNNSAIGRDPQNDLGLTPFGGSSGSAAARTPRALAGLLQLVGIPRPSSENLVQYAIATYARRRPWTDRDREEAKEFARTVCRAVDDRFPIPVHYLGIWDTVSAPGIFSRDLRFEDTKKLTNVRAGRHAISVDEKRRPYRESPSPIRTSRKRGLPDSI